MNSIIENSILPKLSEFKIDEIKPSIDYLVNEAEKIINMIIHEKKNEWNSILKLEEKNEKISQAFSTISHMNAVCNSKKQRENYEYSIAKLTNYYTKLGQNKDIYKIYIELQKKRNLSNEQYQAIRKAIINFKQSGVNLDINKRKKLQKISQEIVKLSSKFENNVLDSTMDWLYITDDKNELKGLSIDIIKSAAFKAKQKNIIDKYVLGIDSPTYLAVMQQAENRKLREIFYKAYSTKASKEADNKNFDNDEIIEKIVNLRLEKAKILGFENYAQKSIFTKMAENPNQVLELLNRLLKKALPQAKKELNELSNFAKNIEPIDRLEPWDVSYFSEKLKKNKFDFTDEEIKKYFPLEKVQDGLFIILKHLYDLDVKENTKYNKYISEQKTFDFFTKNKYIGSVICDFFARDNKRSGAWMDSSRTAFTNSNGFKQNPVAYVNCNFSPPSNGNANLTHNDVITLFHEFGHALHHILSQVNIPSISGTNGVEWDAVELPSQFMENFCWHKKSLVLISGSKCGKILNNEQINKIISTRKFNSALMMVRQIEFSIFDINIHQYKETITINEIQTELNNIRSKINLLNIPSYNKFQNSFSHIFAGGYAAGYYSYKWAEILSSDIFSRFEKEGIFNRETGIDLLENIISRGSSRDAMDNFIAFMNRKPNEEAILKHNGIY